MKKLSIIIILASMTSCGTSINVVDGAEVSKDISFRSVNKWQIHCKLKGNGVMVAQYKYDESSSLDRKEHAFQYAEKLEKENDLILEAIPKPVPSTYGLVLNNQ